MWQAEIISLDNGTTKYKIRQGEYPMSFKNVFELLQVSGEFVSFLNELLATSPFLAYFWEVKPVTMNTYNEAFEFVLIDSQSLVNIQANKIDFQKYFEGHLYVTSFLNLSKDSKLIVPVELFPAAHYAHLAKFVRNAPFEQRIAFWKLVAAEFSISIGDKAKWLNTSGLGVHWLHVRIDSRPKYYNHVPYKEAIH